MFLQTFIVVLSPLLFAGIAWYFIKSRKQLEEEEKLEMQRMQLHDKEIAQDEAMIDKTLEDSKIRGEMIVKLSEKIAQDLILELERILDAKKDSFKTVVPDDEKFELQLTSIFTSIKSQYLERVMQIMKGLKDFEHLKAHNVVAFAEAQYDKTEKSLMQVREEELNALKDKMDRYKSEEINLFNQKVKAVLDAAVKDVLGHALSSTEQEELIIKALENARKNNAL
jgi:hypothetical protein